VHYSKIDWWIAGLVALALIVPLCLGIHYLISSAGDFKLALSLLLVVFVDCVLIAVMGYPLYYQVTPMDLVIRSGVIRWRIPLAMIQEIRPTRNPLSAPALSLDRLRVTYKKDRGQAYIFISPRKKQALLEEIVKGSPGLVQHGDTVSRSSSLV
jgi:membrane protein YdbS with pleckstrin-like domain